MDLLTGQTEPVSLAYFKNYSRTQGFSFDTNGIGIQEPITATLPGGQNSITIPTLINTVMVLLTRDGVGYTQAEAPANQVYSFDPTTGEITFNNVANSGGEPLGITYGVAVDGSSLVTFVSDDTLLQDMITSAREAVERWTGMALVPHQWKVKVSNSLGEVELPFSNGTTTIDTWRDADGATVTGYEIEQGQNVIITSPMYNNMAITYSVVPVCPVRLKQAICAEALYRYENRGDLQEQGYLSQKAMSLAASYKRVSTWLA